MSMSSRVALAASQAEKEVRPYPYVEAVGSQGNPSWDYSSFLAGDRLAAEELVRREEAARELGRKQAEMDSRALLEAELVKAREAMAEMLAAFARERQAFYQKVEPEIVSLALNIARKILHREAVVDPLLLAGMVRVALEQIEFSTQVTVRVHPRLAPSWREYFTRHIDPADLPQLIEDPTLEENRCVLETHLGKTELGWEVQFKEIEQGLLDLLAQRPGSGV